MSWGYRITTVFTAFVLFMGFMVWKSCGENIELVNEDYYALEINYQEAMERADNYQGLGDTIAFYQDRDYMTFQIPGSEISDIKVNFLRPSDSRYDMTFESENPGKGKLELEKKGMLPGHYRVSVLWNIGEKAFQADFPVNIEN